MVSYKLCYFSSPSSRLARFRRYQTFSSVSNNSRLALSNWRPVRKNYCSKGYILIWVGIVSANLHIQAIRCAFVINYFSLRGLAVSDGTINNPSRLTNVMVAKSLKSRLQRVVFMLRHGYNSERYNSDEESWENIA